MAAHWYVVFIKNAMYLGGEIYFNETSEIDEEAQIQASYIHSHVTDI